MFDSMEPLEIRKLNETVVNRIAAGEVIIRPANALKELLENSLDAKATQIQITVKSGGLKLLQIQDNGTGIRKDDLEIVCERFTTSKLEKFEDLSAIQTYGFRGEALASISHVAHLTIQTKTIHDKCAYKASYEDSNLKAPPKACAGNQGTIITVEDLFYNLRQRREGLKSPREEFQLISDVVGKYSIHNPTIGFMLKKQGENPWLRTPPNSTVVDNIRIVYGESIAKELMAIELEDDQLSFKMKGYITGLEFAGRRGSNLLFINHRLVISSALDAAIESIYSEFMAKSKYPFSYVSIDINPGNVDVNVHPTKHEVHFLNEDEIIAKIKAYLESRLLASNEIRKFYIQTRLPGASETQDDEKEKMNTTVSQKYLIRTDPNEQKLEKFFGSPTKKKMRIAEDGMQVDLTEIEETENGIGLEIQNRSTLKRNENQLDESASKSPISIKAMQKRKETKLTSVLNMRHAVEKRCSTEVRSILRNMSFVGLVDSNYALFQYETKLFLSETQKLNHELFYQLLIYDFENFDTIKFNPSLNTFQLAMIALDMPESGWTEDDDPRDDLAKRVQEVLVEKAPIMRQYFGLDIDKAGNLETLPQLLKHHKPPLCRLPIYLLRLATEVPWDSEEECFESFCQETAKFYSYLPVMSEASEEQRWMVEHVIYPAFRQYLIPSRQIKDSLLEVTNLPTLYKVFERC